MNFADAIRQAAKNAAEHPKETGYEAPDFDQEPTTEASGSVQSAEAAPATMAFVENTTPASSSEATAPEFDAADDPIEEFEFSAPEAAAASFAFDAATAEPVLMPEAPSGSVRSGNVVRLELFLGPDQLSGLFRALIATQHGMMTLREAANYLRVNAQVVETMATNGELPALLIDGKWRFPKTSLDEWLSVQVFRNKGESDAA